jgi:hypothetical protein
MKKNNKKTIVLLVILISAVLLAIVLLSTTLAKFMATASSKATARVAKWGVAVDGGSDIPDSYGRVGEGADSFEMVVSSNGKNSILPGTKGSLAWFSISGKPETTYNIDFEGTFSLGSGFTDESRLIRDKRQLPIEYFPIVINIYTVENNEKTVIGTYAYSNDLATLSANINSTINDNLDSSNNPNVNINRTYVVEWDWPYESNSTYQSDFLDTALCEAIANNPNTDLFDISLDMKLTVTQVD